MKQFSLGNLIYMIISRSLLNPVKVEIYIFISSHIRGLDLRPGPICLLRYSGSCSLRKKKENENACFPSLETIYFLCCDAHYLFHFRNLFNSWISVLFSLPRACECLGESHSLGNRVSLRVQLWAYMLKMYLYSKGSSTWVVVVMCNQDRFFWVFLQSALPMFCCSYICCFRCFSFCGR